MDLNVSLSTLRSETPSASPGGHRAATPGRFAQVLQTANSHHADFSPSAASRVVKAGDTLVGLVKSHLLAQGQPVNDAQVYRQALQVAKVNGIQNPDLIFPNQVIQMDLGIANGQSNPTQAVATRLNRPPTAAIKPTSAVQTASHELLGKTLNRAVSKGFIEAGQAPAVARKVLALSEKFRFQPDDFARLTLMESGGMNPRASNGSCHGIIQFCAGNNRGAAAVGLRENPQAILGMGLLQQLDLVDAYFEHVGLAAGKQAISLDELYLSVLTPAARAERGRDVPLPIPGRQAKDLHVGGNRNSPITRNSIVQGLQALADRVFGPSSSSQRQASLYAALSPADPES